MSGRQPNTVDRVTVLFSFENFTVHPAQYWIKETELMEDGYAVVYNEDDVVQLYSPSIMGALQHAGAGDQTLQFVAALAEAATLEGSTEGLLGDALPGPDDVIN